jgi:uncharacterized protein YfaS (alpha-2-macroglobulin family)
MLLLVLILTIVGCSRVNLTSGNPLPAVSPLPTAQLPDWIEQISPTGEAAPTAQIRIRFKEPLIPVESLESTDRQAILKKFELMPPLPGQFRFLTPRMVGFQAEQAIPKATRVQVTLKAGLADLNNHRLDRDLAWTFNTEAIKLTNLPGSPPAGSPDSFTAEPFDLKPVLKLTANVELNQASLQEHVQLIPTGEKTSVPLKVSLEPQNTELASAETKFDPSQRPWVYLIEPHRSLNKATRHQFNVLPGLRPANGNLPSATTFASQIETYAPLAFQKLSFYGQPDAGGAYGRFVNGAAQLQFNNGLAAETAIANITLNPAPKPGPPLVQVYQGEKMINLNPWAIAPGTTYTITIGANLKDIYGQTLGKPVTLTYNPGDVSPDIWAPTGLNIFPTGKNLQLNLSTINLSEYKADFVPVEPTDLVYFDSAAPKDSSGGLLRDPGSWKQTQITSKKNQTVEVPIPLRSQLAAPTGMLAYGIQSRTNAYKEDSKEKWREPTIYGMVQITNLGVFAQWFPESGFVRVHQLSDGAAVSNATVEIYPSKLEAKSRPEPVACATGTTDRSGMVKFDRSSLQKCLDTPTGFTTAPTLLVVAQVGKDWAFTRSTEYSGAYEYGIYAGWQSTKPESRGMIFSDRQLYQPGETAWLTGTAYYLKNGILQQDKRIPYAITLRDPNGQETDLGTQTTNEFGTFSMEVPIGKTAPLGHYAIRAKSEDGVEINGEFRVSEFKPPNFQVQLSLTGGSNNDGAAPIVTVGQTIEAKTQSNYLFGAPLEGGKAQYYVTRQQTEFAPAGWEGFSFGRRWFWPQEAPTVSSDVLQASQTLDANGQSSQPIKLDAELPYPMRYRVDVQVTDVANLSVADSKTFLALPSDRLIGLKTEFVAEAGKAFPVQVIVTDPTGQAIDNQRVRLELQQMNYSRMARLVEGSRTDQNQVEYKTIATADAQPGKTPQSVSLTAPTAGAYRIRATFADKSTEVSATDVQIWVTGTSLASWGDRYRNNRLEIQLDRSSYQPGDLATALIQSPYPEGELYFAVVRHKTLYQTITKVKGSAPQIQFRITPEMLPNAAVEAVLVRQGKPIAQIEPGSLDELVRIGFAPFSTTLSNQYLKVEATVTPSLQPGEQQTAQFLLKDVQGRPTPGQLTIMVVNEAVLQLSGYRAPDLVKTVYANQPISVRLSDNRPDVVLQPQASPIEKGWGFGGGLSIGSGSSRLRTDFRALAYYNGSVVTDANGKASVTFKLPDDLTTWRVMAVATDGKLHFGNSDATFVTTKPLIANPLLPQFARPGDRLQIGVAVTNNTGQTGTLSVQGAVAEPLKFEHTSGSQQDTIAAGTRAYRFPIVVQGVGDAKVRFTTQLNTATDGFEVPLVLKPLAVTEQVIETGSTNREAKIPLHVDKNVANDAGGLEIAFASTLVPSLTAPVQQVLEQRDLPFLQPAASQLAIAASLRQLSQTDQQTLTDFDSTQQATQAIERLQKLQQPDGGFAAWLGQNRSDPFVTPYAAQSLAQAMQAFDPTPPNSEPQASLRQAAANLVPALTDYLKKVLADPGQFDFCQEALCKTQVRLETLIGLAALGDRRNDFLSDLYGQRDRLDAVSQLKLARYLSATPGWQSEGQTMTRQLQQTFYQTGRSTAVNLPDRWRWLNSPTIAQAEALRLMIAQKARPEDLNRLVQGLLSLRRNGTWQNPYDNAVALTALVEYSQLQPIPPKFEATVQLAGKQLGNASFNGYQSASRTLKVPIAELPRDHHDLILKKTGSGTLHYGVAYRYRLQGDQPGRLNGLRITRTVRPANQNQVLHYAGLSSPEPLKLQVGQVLDIGLEIITDRPVDQVLITDPLPAGFEAVDNSFQTTTPYFQAQTDSWELGFRTIHRDRIVAFGERLNPGVYSLHYLVRSVTPGTFLYTGAEVHLQYAPEEFGRTATSTLIVE